MLNFPVRAGVCARERVFFIWFKWVCNCLYYFHYFIYLANNIFLMKVTNWWGTPRTSQAHNIGWVVNSVCVIRWSVLYSAYTLVKVWPVFFFSSSSFFRPSFTVGGTEFTFAVKPLAFLLFLLIICSRAKCRKTLFRWIKNF